MAKINKKLAKEIKEGKELKIIIGAYGDMEDCIGIVEEVIQPKEGGIFSKLVGCSYLFKGYPDVRIVEMLNLPKDMISILPWKFFGLFKVVVVVLFFVARKRLIKFCSIYFDVAYSPLAKHSLIIPPNKYCVAVRELHRAMTVAIEKIRSKVIREILFKIRDIVCMSLDYDSAYKFRYQDIVPEIDKEALRKNPIKELRRVSDILNRREGTAEAMIAKWKMMRKVVLFFLMFNRKAREWVVEFLCELDFKKVGFDEADWYFCLKRSQYNFGGVPLKERLREKEKIDKEKKHDIPKAVVKTITIPPGEKLTQEKINEITKEEEKKYEQEEKQKI